MLKMSVKNNNEPRKATIGKRVYYASLILTCVVLLLALFLIKTEDANLLTYYRYFVGFIAFSFLIPSGAIVREFCVEEYILKKMIIKIIVGVVIVAGGTISLILIKTVSFALIIMFLGIAYLLYAITPTFKKENN